MQHACLAQFTKPGLTVKWLHVDIFNTFNVQCEVTLPYSKRRKFLSSEWGGRNEVTLHPSSPSIVMLQQMAHPPSNTATSWWWYPTVRVRFYLWVFMQMCSCCTLFSSMTHQILDNLSTHTRLWVSTEQKVPDDKQNMVWRFCHRPAVYTPGFDSLDTNTQEFRV